MKLKIKFLKLIIYQTNPNVPAVKPTTKKKINSAKSLGIELTISLS